MEWFGAVSATVTAWWATFQPWLEQYLFLAAFTFGLLESCVLTGYFFPGGNLLIAVGMLASGNLAALPGLVVAAAAGSLLGDCLDYLIGWQSGRSLGRFARFSRGQVLVRRLLDRYGPVVFVVAKFVQAFRSSVAVGAGASGVPLRVFAGYSALAGVLWSGLAIGAGFFGGGVILAAWESPGRVYWLAALSALGIASWLAIGWWSARLTRQAMRDEP